MISDHVFLNKTYPLVICYIANENCTFSSLIYLSKVVIFLCFLYVYQRLVLKETLLSRVHPADVGHWEV